MTERRTLTESVRLRPVTEGDEAFLRTVYASTREAELAYFPFTDDQRAAFLDMQYEAQKRSYWHDYPKGAHSVVMVGDEAVGRMWVDRSDTEIRLIDIALLPERRGQGVGGILLRRLQDQARAAGLPLRHMVLKTNTDGLRFYERLGFAVVDEIPSHFAMEWRATETTEPA